MNRKGLPRNYRSPAIDRILAKTTEDDNGCWIFHGSDNGVGYGVVFNEGRQEYTHRVTYEFFIAEIPEGLQIDHLCRQRRCCNPWHLDPVTTAVNVARGEARLRSGAWRADFELSKTHCPAGHAYDSENTYITSKGHRQCRLCKTAAELRYREANREVIAARARAYRARKKAS